MSWCTPTYSIISLQPIYIFYAKNNAWETLNVKWEQVPVFLEPRTLNYNHFSSFHTAWIDMYHVETCKFQKLQGRLSIFFKVGATYLTGFSLKITQNQVKARCLGHNILNIYWKVYGTTRLITKMNKSTIIMLLKRS